MDLGTIRQEALDFGFTLAEPIAISTIHTSTMTGMPRVVSLP